jgi:type II secretory pathway pseudopilin PulG
MKKGAMFGLDARIALAIFGALSVISGAALYSAIQNSKVTSLIVQIEEVAKATESYVLDMGADLPQFETHAVETEIIRLVTTNGSSAWKGPYLTIQRSSADKEFILNNLSFHLYKCTNTFGNQFSNVGCIACTDVSDCYSWLKIAGDSLTVESVKSIDEKVDGGDGYDSGKFRVQWADAAESDNIRAFYKVMPALSLNN